VEQLRRYQTQIDDQVKGGTHEFLDLSTKLMGERTKEMQGLYRELLAQPFDFTTDESFQTDFEKAAFPVDKAAQRELWRKLLKYETLSRVSEMKQLSPVLPRPPQPRPIPPRPLLPSLCVRPPKWKSKPASAC
jgi:carboxyl-terminal processing protease